MRWRRGGFRTGRPQVNPPCSRPADVHTQAGLGFGRCGERKRLPSNAPTGHNTPTAARNAGCSLPGSPELLRFAAVFWNRPV